MTVCELCNEPILDGETSIATIVNGTVHWECYEND